MLVFKGFKFQKTENVGSVLAVLPKFQRVQYIIWTLFFVLSWKHSELLRQIGKCAVICYYVFFSNLTGFSPEVATISSVPFLWEMSLNQMISWSMIVTQKRGRRGGGGEWTWVWKSGGKCPHVQDIVRYFRKTTQLAAWWRDNLLSGPCHFKILFFSRHTVVCVGYLINWLVVWWTVVGFEGWEGVFLNIYTSRIMNIL